MAVAKKNSFEVYYGLASEKSAFTSMLLGDKFFETDTQIMFVYNGSSWVPDERNAAVSVSISSTRPDNVTAYSAADVVGESPAANLAFASVNSSSGKTVIITGVSLEVDVSSVPAGMSSFKLHLYTSAPTAIADNTAYNLPSGDRAKYAGWIDIDKPIDIGDTLFVRMNNVNFQITPAAQTLYGMLETNAAYTPTAQAVKKVTIHCLEV